MFPTSKINALTNVLTATPVLLSRILKFGLLL